MNSLNPLKKQKHLKLLVHTNYRRTCYYVNHMINATKHFSNRYSRKQFVFYFQGKMQQLEQNIVLIMEHMSRVCIYKSVCIADAYAYR